MTAEVEPRLPGRAPTRTMAAHVREAHAGVVRVEVSGEIDVTNTAELIAAVSQALAVGPDLVEVDLSGVTFLGCAAIAALSALRRGTPGLVVVNASNVAHRLLSIADRHRT